jgi:hypothetical protein
MQRETTRNLTQNDTKQYEIIVSCPLISSIYRLVCETLRNCFHEKTIHTIHKIKRKRENTKHA